MSVKDSGVILLEQLENLAALSNNYGLIEIKPFRVWAGSKTWSHAIFKLRLCNSEEVLELSSYIDQFSPTAKEYAIKLETVIRSLHTINGIGVGTPEQVLKYNTDNNTNLTRVEYLRIWAKNFEQPVIETLYNTYIALQLKQIRLITNQVACEECGQVYDKNKMPDNSKEILYTTSEIVCGHCISSIDTNNYDFKESIDYVNSNLEPSQNIITNEKAPYTCVCGQGFNTIEEFTSHKVDCAEINK